MLGYGFISALMRKSLVEAKGDIIVATGPSAVTRLAGGASRQVLTRSPDETVGLGWKRPPSVATWRRFLSGELIDAQYLAAFDDAMGGAEVVVGFIAPCAMSATNLHVQIYTAPGEGAGRTFTLCVNRGASALTCTISDEEYDGSDTTHVVSIAAGDLVDLLHTEVGSPVAARGCAAVGLEPAL